MPSYLVHGFRWPRAAIRYHIVVFDLEDAAAEWIVAPGTATTLLNSFYILYDFLPPSEPPFPAAAKSSPTSEKSAQSKDEGAVGARPGSGARKGSQGSKKGIAFNDWSVVKLLEQHDLDDLYTSSQPFAYVADYIVPVTLSVDIEAEVAAYKEKQGAEEGEMQSAETVTGSAAEGNGADAVSPSRSDQEVQGKGEGPSWLRKLRDQLAKGDPIGWYVVVCGDEERVVPDLQDLKIDVGRDRASEEDAQQKTPRSGGFRSLFGKRDRQPSAGTSAATDEMT